MLTIVNGDLWDYHARGYGVVIPTNLQVRADGTAVMGAGLAKQAAERFPEVPRKYAQHILLGYAGGRPWESSEDRLILLPTKEHWKDPSPLWLVERGIGWLACRFAGPSQQVALPLLGCGLGGLDWEQDVRPICERHLSGPQFVVVR